MTNQEYENLCSRREQISEAAANFSVKCREDMKSIIKVAFEEGAKWADSHRNIDPRDYFMSQPLPIQRDDKGKVTEETKEILRNLPTNMGIIARKMNDNMIYFLDPEANNLNDYAVLDEFTDFQEIKVVYLA